MKVKGMFMSSTEHWATPRELYQELDAEFGFNDDPCPLHSTEDGLSREWGSVTFVNPPYGRKITTWLRKAYEESRKGKTIVCLLPSRTDTRWWHDYVMRANQIRFLKGRLKFGNSKNSAPFPSVVAVFNKIEIPDTESK
jgi:site-specific DNA-methyltransferase (adenine-specific)